MPRKHTPLARAFHWIVLVLYVYGVAKQLDDVSQLEDARLLVMETVFAVVFLSVVLARYAYMRRFETFAAARAPIDPRRGGVVSGCGRSELVFRGSDDALTVLVQVVRDRRGSLITIT